MNELDHVRGYGAPRSTNDLLQMYAIGPREDLDAPEVRMRAVIGVQELYRRGFTNPAALSFSLGIPPALVNEILAVARAGDLERLNYVDLMRADLVVELEGIQRELWETVSAEGATPTQRNKSLGLLVQVVSEKAKILGLHESRVTVTNKREVEINAADPASLRELAEATGLDQSKIQQIGDLAAQLRAEDLKYGT